MWRSTPIAVRAIDHKLNDYFSPTKLLWRQLVSNFRAISMLKLIAAYDYMRIPNGKPHASNASCKQFKRYSMIHGLHSYTRSMMKGRWNFPHYISCVCLSWESCGEKCRIKYIYEHLPTTLIPMWVHLIEVRSYF